MLSGLKIARSSFPLHQPLNLRYSSTITLFVANDLFIYLLQVLVFIIPIVFALLVLPNWGTATCQTTSASQVINKLNNHSRG